MINYGLKDTQAFKDGNIYNIEPKFEVWDLLGRYVSEITQDMFVENKGILSMTGTGGDSFPIGQALSRSFECTLYDEDRELIELLDLLVEWFVWGP